MRRNHRACQFRRARDKPQLGRLTHRRKELDCTLCIELYNT